MTDSPHLNRSGKYPPGYFQLRRLLGEIVGLIYELRIDQFASAPFYELLGFINSLLTDLIVDDECGLIGATPERCVTFAEGIG